MTKEKTAPRAVSALLVPFTQLFRLDIWVGTRGKGAVSYSMPGRDPVAQISSDENDNQVSWVEKMRQMQIA